MNKPGYYDGPFPVIVLEGTPFYVNGYTMELVQVEDPANRINTFDMMCLEDHVELWYDTESRNAYEGQHFGEIPERVKLFWLYPLEALDPLGKNK
jgi:hypothetical protein